MDAPKSLADAAVRAARTAALDEPHIAPLATFVARLRAQMGETYQIPDFDPFDGGVKAECMFLLEAPGPKAVLSGFISRNNPDETAKNFFDLNKAVGLDRRRTITWNVVPWYIGTGIKIREANINDIQAALPSLKELLGCLSALKIIVLVGQKAAFAEPLIAQLNPALRLFRCHHPSPQFVNRAPDNRSLIQAQLRAVVAALNDTRAGNHAIHRENMPSSPSSALERKGQADGLLWADRRNCMKFGE